MEASPFVVMGEHAYVVSIVCTGVLLLVMVMLMITICMLIKFARREVLSHTDVSVLKKLIRENDEGEGGTQGSAGADVEELPPPPPDIFVAATGECYHTEPGCRGLKTADAVYTRRACRMCRSGRSAPLPPDPQAGSGTISAGTVRHRR